MKRWLIYLTIALLTFFSGVNVQSLAIRTPVPSPRPTVETAVPVIQSAPKPSEVPISLPPPTFVLAYDPEEFDPRGDYFILGRKPKDLREFDCFELVVEGWQGKPIGHATLTTEYFGNNPEYSITSGNGDYAITGFVTQERLAFIATSKSREDFQFIFEGHFLRGGTVSNARSNEAVIRGTLTKLKGPVKVAESTVELRVEYLGC
jgi:hypothetical protein